MTIESGIKEKNRLMLASEMKAVYSSFILLSVQSLYNLTINYFPRRSSTLTVTIVHSHPLSFHLATFYLSSTVNYHTLTGSFLPSASVLLPTRLSPSLSLYLLHKFIMLGTGRGRFGYEQI